MMNNNRVVTVEMIKILKITQDIIIIKAAKNLMSIHKRELEKEALKKGKDKVSITNSSMLKIKKVRALKSLEVLRCLGPVHQDKEMWI